MGDGLLSTDEAIARLREHMAAALAVGDFEAYKTTAKLFNNVLESCDSEARWAIKLPWIFTCAFTGRIP